MTDPTSSLPPAIVNLYPGAAADEQTNSAAQEASARAGLERNLAGGVDPDYAKALENFASMSHEEIYTKTQTMDPASLSNTAKAWGESMGRIAGLMTGTLMTVGGEIGRNWTGAAADAAQTSMFALHSEGNYTGQVMTDVGSRLTQASYATAAVKTAVPPPPPPITPLSAMSAALLSPAGAVAVAAQEKQAEELRQQAVSVMNTVYATSVKPTGDGVPTFSSSPGTTGTGSPVPGGGGSDQMDAPVFSPGAGSGGASLSPGNTTPAGENPAGDAGQTAQGQSSAAGSQGDAGQGAGGSGAAGDQGSAPLSGTPPLTSAASLGGDGTSGVGGLPVGADGSGAGGGSGVGAGAGGMLGGIGGSGNNKRRDSSAGGMTGMGVGALGGGMAGAMLGGSDVARSGASVAAGAAAAARGAGSPAGMMPHAGRKGEGDEDSEHKTPTYLVNVDNGTELIGDTRLAAPPVLGVWDERE